MKQSKSQGDDINQPIAPNAQKVTLNLEPESIIDHLMVCEEFFRWSVEKPKLCQSLVRLVSDKSTQAALGQYLTNLPLVLGQRSAEFLNAMQECRRDKLKIMLDDRRLFDAICGVDILPIPMLWHFSELAQQYWLAFVQPESSWLDRGVAVNHSWVRTPHSADNDSDDDDSSDDFDPDDVITSIPNINPVGFCLGNYGANANNQQQNNAHQDPALDPKMHSYGTASLNAHLERQRLANQNRVAHLPPILEDCPECRAPRGNKVLVVDLNKKIEVFQRFLVPKELICFANLNDLPFFDDKHLKVIRPLSYVPLTKAYLYALKIAKKSNPMGLMRDMIVQTDPLLQTFRTVQNQKCYVSDMSRVLLFDPVFCEKFVGSTRNGILASATAAGIRRADEVSLEFFIDGRTSVDLLFRWITIHGAQEPMGFSLADERFWSQILTYKNIPREVKASIYAKLLRDPQQFAQCVAQAQGVQNADSRLAFASFLFDAISSTLENDLATEVRPELVKPCQDLMVLLGKPAYGQVSQGKPLPFTAYVRHVSSIEKTAAASQGWSELRQEMTTIFVPARQLNAQQVIVERLTGLELETLLDIKQINIRRGFAADHPLDLTAIYLRMRKILMQQTVLVIPFDYAAKDFLLKDTQTQGRRAKQADFADISTATLSKLEEGFSPFPCYLAILTPELVNSAFNHPEKCFVILSEEAKREACFGLQGARDRYTSTTMDHIAHLLPHLSDTLFTQLAIYAVSGECAGNLPLNEISVSFPVTFSIKRHLTHVHLSKRDLDFTSQLQDQIKTQEKIHRSIPVSLMQDQAYVTQGFKVARAEVAFSEVQNPYTAHLQKILEILQKDTEPKWQERLKLFLFLMPGLRNMVMPDQYHHSLIGYILKKEKVDTHSVVACLIDLIKLDANPCIPDCLQGGYYPLQYLIAEGGVAAVGKVEFHSIINAYYHLRADGQMLDCPIYVDPEAKERQRIQNIKNLKEEFPVTQFIFHELMKRRSLAGDLLRHPNLIPYLIDQNTDDEGILEYVAVIGEICALAEAAFRCSFTDHLDKNCILLLGHSRIPSPIKLFIYAHVPEMTESLWTTFEDPLQRQQLLSGSNGKQVISVMVKSLATMKQNETDRFTKVRAFKLFCAISPELAKTLSLEERIFLGNFAADCIAKSYHEVLGIVAPFHEFGWNGLSDGQRRITEAFLQSPLCYRPDGHAEDKLNIDFLACYHFAEFNSNALLEILLSKRSMTLSAKERLTLCQQFVRTNVSEMGWNHFFKQYAFEGADEKELTALFRAVYPNKIGLRTFVQLMASNATAIKIFQGYFRQAANMAQLCDADKVVGEWRWPQGSTFANKEPNDLLCAWARALYLEGQKDNASFDPATLKNNHSLMRYWCQQRRHFSGGKQVLVLDKTDFSQRVKSPWLFLAKGEDASKGCRYPIEVFQHLEDIALMNFETSDQLIVSLENLARTGGALLEPILNAAALRLREAFNDKMLTPALIQLEVANVIRHPNFNNQVGAVANFGKQGLQPHNIKAKLIELLKDYKNAYSYQIDKTHIECAKF